MADNEHPLLSNRELMGELKQLVRKRSTGVMFISTVDNHAIQFCLSKGNITGCRFRFKRGLDAIPFILEMEAGRYSFNIGSPGPGDNNLPPTDSLIKMLTEKSQQSVPGDMPVNAGVDLNALPSIITDELARYLGPIAAVLVEDYLEDAGPIRDSGSLQKLMKSVATEITEDNKRDEFIRDVMSKL